MLPTMCWFFSGIFRVGWPWLWNEIQILESGFCALLSVPIWWVSWQFWFHKLEKEQTKDAHSLRKGDDWLWWNTFCSLFVCLRASNKRSRSCVGKSHLSMHETTNGTVGTPHRFRETIRTAQPKQWSSVVVSCRLKACPWIAAASARRIALSSWKSTCGSSIPLSWRWSLNWPITQVAGCSKVRKRKIIQMMIDAFLVVWLCWNWNPKMIPFAVFSATSSRVNLAIEITPLLENVPLPSHWDIGISWHFTLPG